MQSLKDFKMSVAKQINNLEIAYRRIRKSCKDNLWTEEQLRGLEERFNKRKSDLLDQHIKPINQ